MPRSGGRSIGILSFVCTLIFALAVLASAGVFVYEKYLGGRIANMEESLTAAREALQPSLIQELLREDSRIVAAEQVVQNHVSLSALLELIQSLTLRSVRFTSFEYEIDETNPNLITITMAGEARTYANVALQEKVLADNQNFINPQFSDLDLNERGDITFTLTANINPDAVSYNRIISEQNLPPVEEAPTANEATTTPVEVGGTGSGDNVEI